MAGEFDDLLALIDAEAAQRGPAAVEALRALDAHFAAAAALATAARETAAGLAHADG